MRALRVVRVARRMRERLAHARQNRALIVLLILTVLFLGLSLLAHDPQLAELDRRITLWFQAFRTPVLDRVVVAITHLGAAGWLIVVGLGAAAVLLRSGKPRAAVLCASTLLVFQLNGILKLWVGRPRPGGHGVDVLLPALGLSFPSGHAMSAATVYGFVGLMAWLHLTRPAARRAGMLVCAFVALAVGLSRVYLGVHWLSDVLGGWVAGLLLLLLFALLYKRFGGDEVDTAAAPPAESGSPDCVGPEGSGDIPAHGR